MNQFLENYRSLWRLQADDAKPFGIERPALFSPAAAAQEPMNASRIWRRWGNTMLPWQFGDWIKEATAVHETAFIGDWSALSKVLIKGPDARRFLDRVGVADLSRFAVGRIRHFVCVNDGGKVATEGVLGRLAEDAFFYTGGGGEWLLYQYGQGTWDAEVSLASSDYFMFEIQGPNSFKILEASCHSSIRDLEFNRWMTNRVGGAEVRVLRTGVSGELGYEIHGPSQVAAQVWVEVLRAGEEFGIVPLGMRAQVLAHVEAGIATVGFDYMPSTLSAPIKSVTSVSGPGQRIGGTYEFNKIDDFYRSPFELNWCSPNVVRTREFVGSEALRVELDNDVPKRRLFGLIWDKEDVVDVFRTLFAEGTIVPQMDLPRHYAAEYFAVTEKDDVIGVATSRVYSPQLRRVISLCLMNEDTVREQKDVTVVWGQREGARKEIKAQVVELPFTPDRRRNSAT